MTRTAEESQDALGDVGRCGEGRNGGFMSVVQRVQELESLLKPFCLCVPYFLCNFNDAVSDADKKLSAMNITALHFLRTN